MSHSYISTSAYNHTTLNTPVPIWSPKLSSVGPVQYLDGWPPGNHRCCRLPFVLFLFRLSYTSRSHYTHSQCTPHHTHLTVHTSPYTHSHSQIHYDPAWHEFGVRQYSNHQLRLQWLPQPLSRVAKGQRDSELRWPYENHLMCNFKYFGGDTTPVWRCRDLHLLHHQPARQQLSQHDAQYPWYVMWLSCEKDVGHACHVGRMKVIMWLSYEGLQVMW